jgi:N6-L-threonylcarbamoyladenine synthase
MKILGIETSCDDTSLCLLEGSSQSFEQPQIHYHESFSSEAILAKWGGVVPEIAARAHVEKIPFLLKALQDKTKFPLKDLDFIAVTAYPGLLGSLLSGLSMAKSLSLLYKKPILPINHLYAHLEAIHLDQQVPYPYIGLLVSGGHSLYFLVESPKIFKLLGSTIDDAAGEAFDKGGKLMGLSYPSGRIIDEFAKKGNAKAFSFPIGLKDSKDARLSFSGLKTSLRNLLTLEPNLIPEKVNDLCASYQEAIIKALCLKLSYAIRGKEKLPIVVGGGVACNSSLREELRVRYKNVHFVSPKFCTDNAAMIANYGRLISSEQVAFPACLDLDAKSRFFDKEDLK